MSKRIDLLNEKNTYIEDNLAIEINIPSSLDNKPRMVNVFSLFRYKKNNSLYVIV